MGVFGGTKSSSATSNAQSEGATIKSGSWAAGGSGADWFYYSAVASAGFLLWYAWKKAKNKRVK